MARILGLMLLLVPAVVLVTGGAPRVEDGRARDAALPVPASMMTGTLLPLGAYSTAAVALSYVDGDDGEAAITRAEALWHESSTSSDRIGLYQHGLTKAPALVRGWSYLALEEAAGSPANATLILNQALILAPTDFWVAGIRSQASAILWNGLDSDTRALALRQVQLLWDEPLLRPQLYRLLGSTGGPSLVSAAFVGRRNDLVQINRWTSAQARETARP